MLSQAVNQTECTKSLALLEGLSRPGFLRLSTTDILRLDTSLLEAVLCSAGCFATCLAASMRCQYNVSTSQQPQISPDVV